jgi:dTDP-glucose 4,6-dehydratase
MRILIAGGAGFVGSTFIRRVLSETADEIEDLDALTYTSNLEALHQMKR